MRKSNKNLLIKGVTISLVVIFILSALMIILEIWESKQGKFPEVSEEDKKFIYNGVEYVPKDQIETFLVLGLDKFDGEAMTGSYNNDKCADFIMLFVFDNAEKKFSTIHINRDTMAEVDILGVAGDKIDTVTKQITLAHTYGNGKDLSCRNTAESVSRLLNGIKINHYISITMDAVSILNDEVGGVEVTVLDDFTGIDETLVKGEKVILSGEQALTYVRKRYGLEDSSNSARMERQQQYINAFYTKLTQVMEKDDEFVANASIKISDYIVSDRSITRLQELVNKINEYEYLGINDLEGETKMGEKYIEFYPNEESVNKLVAELFYIPKN